MMKKTLFLLPLFLIGSEDIYLNYVNKLVNYNYELKNFEKVIPPFEMKKDNNVSSIVRKSIELEVITILNSSAYIKIIYKTNNVVKRVEKKWLKVGDKVGNCKIVNTIFDRVILECDNKKIIKFPKTLNIKNINIKEER